MITPVVSLSEGGAESPVIISSTIPPYFFCDNYAGGNLPTVTVQPSLIMEEPEYYCRGDGKVISQAVFQPLGGTSTATTCGIAFGNAAWNEDSSQYTVMVKAKADGRKENGTHTRNVNLDVVKTVSGVETCRKTFATVIVSNPHLLYNSLIFSVNNCSPK